MLKETKTEETKDFPVIIFIIGGISVGGDPGPWTPTVSSHS